MPNVSERGRAQGAANTPAHSHIHPPFGRVADAPALIHTAFIQATAAFAGAGSAHAELWTHDHHVSPLMLVAPGLSIA